MEQSSAIEVLSALAQESRLAIFRLLVQQGPDGLPAGEIGRALGIRANALSFHLTRLRYAGLTTARRNGRQIFYAVDYEATRTFMGFLTENCCRESPQGCSPACPQTRSAPTRERPRRQKTGAVHQRLSQS